MGTGRYAIVDILGAGAFAVVCLAREGASGRLVALKALRRHLRNDAEAEDRLRDEGRILDRLKHPSIAALSAVLEYPQGPVLELEPIEGVTLDQLVANGGALPGSVAVAVGRRVAEALAFAYGGDVGGEGPMRVIHRDLKPNNVLLATSGAVKVIDFGIAKGTFEGRAAKSLFLVQGTSGFDAPERKDGHEGPEVDVYGLGALLLTICSGHVPVLSSDPERHRAGRTAHIARVSGDAAVDTVGLRTLIGRMVHHDPAERPTMEQAAASLAAMVGDRADLAGFAEERVRPLLKGRSRDVVTQLDGFADVAFLETESLRNDEGSDSVRHVAAQVRRFLAQPDWERRVPELRRLLSRSDRQVTRPLLEVLDRARVPWYRPWLRAARPGELEAALLLLCDHPDPAVIRRAEALLDHPDARVQAAARFVLR